MNEVFKEFPKQKLIYIRIIQLVDMDFGFIPDNQKQLAKYLVSSAGLIKQNAKVTKRLYTLFPLEFFNQSKSYFENYVEHLDDICSISDSKQIPFQLKKQPGPYLIKQVAINLLTRGVPVREEPDFDEDNFQYSDNTNFVDEQIRNRFFESVPHIFGQKMIEEGFGCEHYARNCSVFCPHCSQEFICEKCHNNQQQQCPKLKPDEILKIRCLHCLCVQDVPDDFLLPDGLSCTFCKEKLSEYYCGLCKIFTMQSPAYKPMFHCERHNVCHNFMTQEHHFYCDGCSECVAPKNLIGHVCWKTAKCCVCSLGFSAANQLLDICENVEHVCHEQCKPKIANHQCPKCGKLNYNMNNCKYIMNQIHKWLEYFKVNQTINVYKCQCLSCQAQFIDSSIAMCPNCLLINQKRIEEIAKLPKPKFCQALLAHKFGGGNSMEAVKQLQFLEGSGAAPLLERLGEHEEVLEYIEAIV